jgi:hypothetical protein
MGIEPGNHPPEIDHRTSEHRHKFIDLVFPSLALFASVNMPQGEQNDRQQIETPCPKKEARRRVPRRVPYYCPFYSKEHFTADIKKSQRHWADHAPKGNVRRDLWRHTA